MNEDPSESFIIQTLLSARPVLGTVPLVDAGEDDACILPGGLAITSDALVDGVHFDHRWSAADIGWRVVAVNASDIGAMGGRPTWMTLALALPRPLDRGWVVAFSAGLHEALRCFRVSLVGGDTLRSNQGVVASVTMGGIAPRPARRSDAQDGDDLWVTGRPGQAAVGFFHGTNAALLRPRPPVEFGAALADNSLVHGMMDISDGIAVDLGRLCRASALGAVVWPESLPELQGLPAGEDPLPLQTSFGDDYELLFTAAPAHAGDIRALAAGWGTSVTRIGAMGGQGSPTLHGRQWPLSTFSHFAGPAVPC